MLQQVQSLSDLPPIKVQNSKVRRDNKITHSILAHKSQSYENKIKINLIFSRCKNNIIVILNLSTQKSILRKNKNKFNFF